MRECCHVVTLPMSRGEPEPERTQPPIPCLHRLAAEQYYRQVEAAPPSPLPLLWFPSTLSGKRYELCILHVCDMSNVDVC